MQGAEILFYPTAIGWHPAEKAGPGARQHDAWETIQRGHAIANGCYVATANRIGHERLAGEGIEFWGQSFVTGTLGEILAKASVDREEIVVVPLDLSAVDTTRTQCLSSGIAESTPMGICQKGWLIRQPNPATSGMRQ